MTWTYGNSPATSARDRVRFLVGDTLTTDQQLTDEEIAWLLIDTPDPTSAAASAADAIAARYARQADTTNGALSVSASQRAASYRTLAGSLRQKAARLGGTRPFLGGSSRAAAVAMTQDSDATQPQIRVGMDDQPGTSDAVEALP